MKANAVSSLYGGSVKRQRASAADALCGNVGGQARVQEVLTPKWILDAVAETFGGRITYDPCASTDRANWFAAKNDKLPGVAVTLERKLAEAREAQDEDAAKALTKRLKPYYLALPPGGAASTLDAFVNPPFAFLENWMQWCHERRGRSIGLWPVRPHRSWWTRYSRLSEVVMLRYDVRFVGHKNAFPAPLCIATYGCILPSLGERETGRWRP